MAHPPVGKIEEASPASYGSGGGERPTAGVTT